MARSYFINGESMVNANGSQLGLAEGPIRVSLEGHYKDIGVDAWGCQQVPPEIQFMLAEARISMTLVHFDRGVLDTCIASSMANGVVGQMPRTGTLMGGSNSFISLQIVSPVAAKPWTFPYSYIAGSFDFPLGTEKSLLQLSWRAIPYAADPWGGGVGSQGAVLWIYA